MRLRTLRCLAPLGLVVLLLPACSSGTDDAAETTLAPATTVVETTTTAPVPTATAPTTTTTTRTTVAATQVSGSLALVNGTLIDGTGAAPVSDGVVVVDGERIVAVGTRDRLSVSPDTPTIDVQGATLLPGFINAHVHASYDEERLAAWAQSGVTTVRDLGAFLDDGASPLPPADVCEAGWGCETAAELFDFRDEVAGNPELARLVAAGPIIGLPRDHDIRGARWIMESPEEARRTVDALIDNGTDLIKLYISEPTENDALTQDTATALVEAAHTRGVPVAAHVLRAIHMPYALEAGVDDLVHMVTTEVDDDVLARAVDDDVYWEPTLELFNCDANLYVVTRNLRRFVQAGGNVALGTDYAGVDCDWDLGMPMSEIELMAEADMTPMQIIVAATNNGAHVCGLEDQIGTLEAGKIADILVVAGDPLEDLQALTDVQMVVHNGVVIRDEISAVE